MAVPLIPLIPVLLRYGPRIALGAKAAWVGWRLYQNRGDIGKTAVAVRDDIVHSYKYVTDAQYRALRKAGETLKQKGGDYASLGDALLLLAELITGTKLTSARDTLKQTGKVLEVYQKLDKTSRDKVQTDTGVDVEAAMNAALANYLYTEGLRIVNDNTATESTLSEHLRQKYLGLYYIGRSGNRFTAEEVDSLVVHLLHFHSQLQDESQTALMDWYTTVGVSKPDNVLPALLDQCPEVQALDVDSRYIAHALNQKIQDIRFDGLRAEISKRMK